MALLKCPDCGHMVSGVAASCPDCGRPFRANYNAVGPTHTIEKTSKTLKAQGCLSALVLFVGIVLLVSGIVKSVSGMQVFGAVAIVVGLLWHIITKIRVWWHHD